MNPKVDPLRFIKEEQTNSEANLMPIIREQARMELDELRQSREPKQSGEPVGLSTGDAGFDMEEKYQQGLMPSRFEVTQRFGNYNPALYKGINQSMTNSGTDFATPTGTPLALPQGNWKIERVANPNGWNQGYGGSIVAVNEDTGEKLRFSHLSRLNAIPGKRLRGGSVIGYSGATGNVTGAHLDLEYYDGKGNLADVLQTRYAKDIFGE